MKNIRGTGFEFRLSALALVAMLSVTTLRGAMASPALHSASAAAAQPVSAAPTTEQGTEIQIDNFVFSPAVVMVKAGTVVTWINKDDIPHTVVSTEGKFKSTALDTDEKFQFRTTTPGEYAFYCRLHPKMTGKIIVQPD